eukprot:TRINITY_DN2509_c0_g1_i1.p1 TRINITY_DN2509_c0_g1~~TRINITY_DN2509_c0_g1_i1.p1  ORF type:complete len:357 (-),score=90.57 TRINITY_DN2509_c0_g1_i1:973-1902(-)
MPLMMHIQQDQEATRPRSSSVGRRPSTPTALPEPHQNGEALKQHMRELLLKEPTGTARHESIRKWLERSEEQETQITQKLEEELEAEEPQPDWRPRKNASLRASAPQHLLFEGTQESAMLMRMRTELAKEPHDSVRRAALVKWIERAEAQQAEMKHSIDLESSERPMAPFGAQQPRPESAPAGGRRRRGGSFHEADGAGATSHRGSTAGMDLLSSLLRFKFGRFRKQLKERKAAAAATNAEDQAITPQSSQSVSEDSAPNVSEDASEDSSANGSEDASEVLLAYNKRQSLEKSLAPFLPSVRPDCSPLA